MAYQIINLETGEFATLTLEEAAALAQLDPADIEWAIEEHGVCETETHQITKLAEAREGDGGGDDDDADDGDSISPLPVFIYISKAEFEARLSGSGTAYAHTIEANLNALTPDTCVGPNSSSQFKPHLNPEWVSHAEAW